MSRFYLSTFVGTGSDDDPFRPPVDGPYAIIDLRGDPSQVDGLCLVWTPDVQPARPGRNSLGDTPDEAMPRAVSRLVENRLGVTLGATGRLRSVVAELLIVHGKDSDRARWNRLRADRQGWHRIYLGGLIYEAPAVEGATIGDTFVEASDTALSAHTATGPIGGFSWSSTSALVVVVAASDTVVSQGASNARSRAGADLDSADHYSQATAVAYPGSITANMGLGVRYNSAADSGYFLFLRDRVDAQYRIFKVATGTLTQLGSSVSEALPTVPAEYSLEADGSNLTGKQAGVTKIGPITDTSFTTQVRAGILMGGPSAAFDDFEAGDLAAPDAFSGGSTATVTVDAQGAGSKQGSGSATADIEVDGAGAGTTSRLSGSTANVTVDAQGAGVSQDAGSAVANVTVDASGAGFKATTGGSTAEIEVDALGGGLAAEPYFWRHQPVSFTRTLVASTPAAPDDPSPWT